MSVIIIFILISLSVCLSAMTAGYATLSTSHLRHWAKRQDSAAKKLYPLKARGAATLLTIELFRSIFLSGALVMIVSRLSAWFAWLIVTTLLFLAFVVLTQLYLKPVGIRLLVWLSAPLLSVVNVLKPITLTLGRVFDKFLDSEPVTLTRQELGQTLEAVSEDDTDISTDELRILRTVLKFSALTVHEVMIPKNKVKSVAVDEPLTPVVIDDLYKSGHSHFPVLGEDKKTVVGILNMHDLMDIKLHSTAQEAMQPKVYYVDEDRDLNHVLEIFYKTKQTVFVVHDSVSEMVGLITVEDVLHQILGKPVTKEEKSHNQSTANSEETPGSEETAVVELPL